MPRRLRTPGLPLLAKELLEQSARRRTYVIRTLYAALLFFGSLLTFYVSTYQNFTNPLDILGRGREVFQSIIALQFAGIFLFMPAITCGVITAEKERNTFGLLLLTRLSPTTILLEKLLSRLVPMGSFLLLSLPLLGVAYAMGGIAQQEFWIAIWSLVLTAVQVGTLALACSAFFRTTVQAFIATYTFGFAIYFGWAILGEMSDVVRELHQFLAAQYVAAVNFFADAYWLQQGQPQRFNVHPGQLEVPFLAPVMLLDRWGAPVWWVIPLSVPSLALIAGLFAAARVFVVRRAFVPSRNLLLKVFRQLDTAFHRLNDNRVTKGVVLFNESASLPDDDPIGWRETRKKSLGMYRYLVRFLVAMEAPVLLVCCFVATGDTSFRGGSSAAVSVLLFIVWIMAALLVTVKAATLISGERSHETLDVLLATPIRSSEIVRQKFGGVRRLMFVLACPLATIVLFQTWFRMSVGGGSPYEMVRYEGDEAPLLYVLAALPAIAIYLPLLAWIGFAIGLRVRSQTRAIFGALALVVAWCAVPFIVALILHEGVRIADYGQSVLNYVFLASPISIIAFAEFSDLEWLNSNPYGATLFNWVMYGVLLLSVREWCLRTASRRLGRAESPRAAPELPPPVSGFSEEMHRRAKRRAAAR